MKYLLAKHLLFFCTILWCKKDIGSKILILLIVIKPLCVLPFFSHVKLRTELGHSKCYVFPCTMTRTWGPRGWEFLLFCSFLHPKHLNQSLAHRKYSVNNRWMDRMNISGCHYSLQLWMSQSNITFNCPLALLRSSGVLQPVKVVCSLGQAALQWKGWGKFWDQLCPSYICGLCISEI